MRLFKFWLFILVGLSVVSGAVKTTSKYGQLLLSRPMNVNEWKFEHYNKWNSAVNDLDTIFTYLWADSIYKPAAKVGTIHSDDYRAISGDRFLIKTRKVPFTFSQFDTSATNTTAQTLKIDSTIAAYARVIDVVIICTDSCQAKTTNAQVAISLSAGTATGSVTAYIASASCNDQGESLAIANGAQYIAAPSAAVGNVWVGGTPGVNWNTIGAGSWDCYITYIDNRSY
jgi:hypothetical protein